MAKKKDKKELDFQVLRYEPAKPKINEQKIKAMEILLKDEGCHNLSRSEMQTIVEAYKAGKRGK